MGLVGGPLKRRTVRRQKQPDPDPEDRWRDRATGPDTGHSHPGTPVGVSHLIPSLLFRIDVQCLPLWLRVTESTPLTPCH